MLFAVLEGRLETVNMVDGILRVVGGRGPGELVGEVPIALGTTFPFGFRAVEPTRLMRLEAEDYHAHGRPVARGGRTAWGARARADRQAPGDHRRNPAATRDRRRPALGSRPTSQLRCFLE